jgi:hypothetical protein
MTLALAAYIAAMHPAPKVATPPRVGYTSTWTKPTKDSPNARGDTTARAALSGAKARIGLTVRDLEIDRPHE